ncbi:phenylalanine--tRNA ligase subunit beta [Patescibacteria group bacterium]|nr:phenylalanine--tRNA ligase subunit beta [Patescibacteria group bacterium]
MKFSYNWLKEYIPKLPEPKQVADLVTRHAFEVSEIKKQKGDVIFDIDILPNRMPDASSHRGLAQEIAAIMKLNLSAKGGSASGGKSQKSKFNLKKKKLKKNDLEISILDKDTVLRYHGALIKSIKIKPSPKWMQERLGALGIKSINNVVDITNYVMVEYGHPLHAFDYEKIHGRTLTIRKAKADEALETLDGVSHSLSDDILVISDKDRIIDLAGIMGGKNSEMDPKTKTVFLQVATFEPTFVHRASRILKKRTEASLRYSAGIDPNLAGLALERALLLLGELADGTVTGFIDIYPKPVYARHIRFRPEKANQVLGTRIPEKEMTSILQRLSFDVSRKKNAPKELIVKVPSLRRDLELEEDLIEEVGRIYGYDQIEAKRPVGELAPAAIDRHLFFKEKIRDLFRASGFDEVRNYAFIGEKHIADLGPQDRSALIEVENPQSREFSHLRPILLPSLAYAVSEALKFSKDIRYFEVGRVYQWLPVTYRDTPDLERLNLAFAITHAKNQEGSQAFFELKGALDTIFESLGLHDVWYDDVPASPETLTQGVGRFLHPYQFSEIKLGEKKLGIFGMLHPALKKKFNIKDDLSVGEVFLDELIGETEKEKEYRPISKYPAVTRDLAILVPRDVRVVKVLDIIENTGGSLLTDVDLFDMYEGDEIVDGKKNFAFHLIFQSTDRTLKDEEVERVMQNIIKALEENIEWEVRK